MSTDPSGPPREDPAGGGPDDAAAGAVLRRTAAGTLMPGFAGEVLPGWVERALREGLGGVCLFGENTADRQRLVALTAAITAARPRAVIAVDEEGGDVTRLHRATGSPEPGSAVLGRLDDAALTAAAARRTARELAAHGITLDLAPSADVNTTADNPVIGTRSFGADPDLVARHTAAWVAACQAEGVAACAKHFPGHGATTEDSHLALPRVPGSREEVGGRDLPPFRAAVAAGVAAVMTAHVVVPAWDDVPATFSHRIVTGLLREELGFTGAVVTDALDMAGAGGDGGPGAAAVRALRAGCDLLCLGPGTTPQQLTSVLDAVVAAVLDGSLPRGRMEEAAARVRALADRAAAGREAAGRAALPPDRTPPPPADDPRPDVPLVLPAVSVLDGVREQLAGPGGLLLLRVRTTANAAVGDLPWGPFAALSGDPRRDRVSVLDVTPGTTADEVAAAAGTRRVVLVGRDNHRQPWVGALAGALRARGPLVVVDAGWPAQDRALADVAGWGASALMGAAVLEVLLGS